MVIMERASDRHIPIDVDKSMEQAADLIQAIQHSISRLHSSSSSSLCLSYSNESITDENVAGNVIHDDIWDSRSSKHHEEEKISQLHYELRGVIEKIGYYLTHPTTSSHTSSNADVWKNSLLLLLHYQCTACITALSFNPLLTLSLWKHYFQRPTYHSTSSSTAVSPLVDTKNLGISLMDILLQTNSYEEFIKQFVHQFFNEKCLKGKSTTFTDSSDSTSELISSSRYLVEMLISFIISSFRTGRSIATAGVMLRHMIHYYTDLPSRYTEELKYIAIHYRPHMDNNRHDDIINDFLHSEDEDSAHRISYSPLACRLGYIAYQNKVYRKSIQFFTNSAVHYYHQIKSLSMIGRCYVQLNEYNKAIEIFQYTVNINPMHRDVVEAKFQMALIFLKQVQKYMNQGTARHASNAAQQAAANTADHSQELQRLIQYRHLVKALKLLDELIETLHNDNDDANDNHSDNRESRHEIGVYNNDDDTDTHNTRIHSSTEKATGSAEISIYILYYYLAIGCTLYYAMDCWQHEQEHDTNRNELSTQYNYKTAYTLLMYILYGYHDHISGNNDDNDIDNKDTNSARMFCHQHQIDVLEFHSLCMTTLIHNYKYDSAIKYFNQNVQEISPSDSPLLVDRDEGNDKARTKSDNTWSTLLMLYCEACINLFQSTNNKNINDEVNDITTTHDTRGYIQSGVEMIDTMLKSSKAINEPTLLSLLNAKTLLINVLYGPEHSVNVIKPVVHNIISSSSSSSPRSSFPSYIVCIFNYCVLELMLSSETNKNSACEVWLIYRKIGMSDNIIQLKHTLDVKINQLIGYTSTSTLSSYSLSSMNDLIPVNSVTPDQLTLMDVIMLRQWVSNIANEVYMNNFKKRMTLANIADSIPSMGVMDVE